MPLIRLVHFRRFMGLPGVERRFLLAAWASLPLVWLTIRVLGWNRARRVLVRRAANLRCAALPPLRAAQLLHIASRRSWPPDNCLARSLLLARHLTRSGMPHELRMGSRRGASGIEAHAWIEVQGSPLGEASESVSRYGAWLPSTGA